MHLSLWMYVMLDFICRGLVELSGMGNRRKFKYGWKYMSLPGIELVTPRFPTVHLKPLGHRNRCYDGFKTFAESWHVNIYTQQYIKKLILVRVVFEQKVRQNLHFFYKCWYYLLLFTGLSMNTSNHNHCINCIVMCSFNLYARILQEF